jgi:iron-sulfur cluster insertion protein
MITVSGGAVDKIRDILAEENNPELKLRVGVQGGGCSGMQYFFTLDPEQTEEDFVIDIGGVQVLVDAVSSQYLRGAEIDYVENITGSNFSINNPNAQTSCGCGSSFGVADSFYDNSDAPGPHESYINN